MTKQTKKTDQFQFASKGFLVTISQIPILKKMEELERVLQLIQNKEQELGNTITALSASLEEHKDKGVHLHFAIAFEKRRVVKPQYWNFLFNKQANIQPITWNKKQSKARAFEYVIKTGDVTFKDKGAEEIISHAPRQFTGTALADFITKIIEEGADFSALKTHPLVEVRTFAMMHKSALVNSILDYATIKYEEQQKNLPKLQIEIDKSFTRKEKELLSYFQKTEKFKSNWPLKASCIMLVSPPSFGKTTLLLEISKYLRTYTFPSSQWFTGYKNNFYELIVWEEPDFRLFSLSFIKKLLEGLALDLPIKGSMSSKKDVPLIVLNSNDTLKQLFISAYIPKHLIHHCNDLQHSLCDCEDYTSCPLRKYINHFLALKARVKEFNFSTKLFHLTKVIKPCV